MSKKSLVAYFSASGTTKKEASLLAKAANADLFERYKRKRTQILGGELELIKIVILAEGGL